ncbi:ankyrin repeat-containing domain, PGG domain protein [Tanacetum coccineum]
MTYYYQHTDLIIYKTAIYDDWERAKTIFQECPALRSKPINVRLDTPLMIAVGTNCSHNFVSGLMFLINPDSDDRHSELYAVNDKGYTALHCAVEVGNTVDASILVSCMPELTLIQNSNGYTPLILAASHGKKDMIQFLRENTLVQPQSYERVGTSIDTCTHWIPIKKSEIRSMSSQVVEEEGTLNKLWGIRDMAPALKNVSEMKEKHYESNMLVKYICKTLIEKEDPDTTWNILGRAIATAVKYGIYELIEECILTYPGINNMTFASSELHEEEQENALHIAAKLAQPHRLNIVTGAALQMQRELQWFKMILSIP